MKRFSFPILFLSLLLLIFSVAFAREQAENKNEKHVTDKVGGIPFFRPRLAFEIPFPRPRDPFPPIHEPPFGGFQPHLPPDPPLRFRPLGPCRFCPNNCCDNGCCSSEEEHAEFEKARRVP
ncbi:unnamed protein product [Victoria cruziana]